MGNKKERLKSEQRARKKARQRGEEAPARPKEIFHNVLHRRVGVYHRTKRDLRVENLIDQLHPKTTQTKPPVPEVAPRLPLPTDWMRLPRAERRALVRAIPPSLEYGWRVVANYSCATCHGPVHLNPHADYLWACLACQCLEREPTASFLPVRPVPPRTKKKSRRRRRPDAAQPLPPSFPGWDEARIQAYFRIAFGFD